MAQEINLSSAVRSAFAQALLAEIDGGSGAAYVEVRTGSKPASPGTAAGGTLLATVTLNDPSFTESAGVLTLATGPTPTTTGAATGTAGWFRVYDSDATAVVDGDAATSGAALNFNTTAIESGGDVSITGGTVTMPS